MNNPVQKLTN